MTLCAAWVREVNNEQELVFATDSCLSCGERWESGVKLFELPRKDCLICFAGDTNRTYPLILNLISSIKFDDHLANTHTDISTVLEYLTNLFSDLCNSIKDYGTQSFKDALGDFQFLFGGWSWQSNSFRLWQLSYNHEFKAFEHNETNSGDMLFTFIGDELEVAKGLLDDELIKNGKVTSRSFDMEPFSVLVQMIRNTDYSGIAGSVQLAKIYPPGSTEFLGVYWPTTAGKKTFLGKNVTSQHNPSVKYVDPETGEVIEDLLPETVSDIDESIYGEHTEFLTKCYPSGKLKSGLAKRDRANLKSIFEQVAYQQFLVNQTESDEVIE